MRPDHLGLLHHFLKSVRRGLHVATAEIPSAIEWRLVVRGHPLAVAFFKGCFAAAVGFEVVFLAHPFATGGLGAFPAPVLPGAFPALLSMNFVFLRLENVRAVYVAIIGFRAFAKLESRLVLQLN